MKNKIIITMTKKNTVTDIKKHMLDKDANIMLKLHHICKGDLQDVFNEVDDPKTLREIAASLKVVRMRLTNIINDIKGTFEAKATKLELHDKVLERMSKENLILYIKELERKLDDE